MTDDVVKLLEDQYGFERVAVEAISGHVYRARGSQPVMVRTGRGAVRMAAALAELERRGYRAPRVCRTLAGESVASLGEERVVVVEWIDGDVTPFTPEGLRGAGAALGRLHALGPVRESSSFRPAQMRPSSEFRGLGLQRIQQHLDSAGRDRGWLAEIEGVAAAIADDFEDCPQTLIHGDAHSWNSVTDLAGSTIYIDWDSAGVGAAVIDLGFLLLSADRGPLTHPPIPSDPARADAVLQGYCAERRPTDVELRRLAGAVMFRALTGVIAQAAGSLRHGNVPSPTSWWDRCLAAPEIAARAAAVIGR